MSKIALADKGIMVSVLDLEARADAPGTHLKRSVTAML